MLRLGRTTSHKLLLPNELIAYIRLIIYIEPLTDKVEGYRSPTFVNNELWFDLDVTYLAAALNTTSNVCFVIGESSVKSGSVQLSTNQASSTDSYSTLATNDHSFIIKYIVVVTAA